jgi:hypothetical protein
MPVPFDRSDEGYFQPLQNLRLTPDTELYLGEMHGDGLGATNRRVAAAAKFAPESGISTECGIARCRTPEVVKLLFRVYAGASCEPGLRAKPAKH